MRGPALSSPAGVPLASGEVAVRAEGLGFAVEGATLLDGVDLDVRAGQVLAVVGPNGAGKSTLLGLLAGDLHPTAGTVRYLTGEPGAAGDAGAGGTGRARDGAPVADAGPIGDVATGLPPAELARRRAVLLQEHRLSFPFTVVEVVRMGRAPWRGRPEEDRDDLAVSEAFDAADVRHLAGRRFPTLSGGEKARTAYARARAQGTSVLLLDEPTAALDIRHQEQVLGHARERALAGDAVVAVLHDLSLAAAHADRVLLLGAGRAHGLGSPAEVLRTDLLTELYQYPVDVFRHPRTGESVVLPDRRRDRPLTATAPPTTAALCDPIPEAIR